MKQIELNSFKGGIYEVTAPSDFNGTQWSEIKGFFLNDENNLRTQWPIQQVSTATGFKEISGLTANDGTKYLVGIKDDLTVWYMVAPTQSDSYSTTKAKTWTALPNLNIAGNLTLSNSAQHFTSEVTASYNGKQCSALLVNQIINKPSYPSADQDHPVYIIAESSSSIGAIHPRHVATYTVTSRTTASGTATLTLSDYHELRIGDTVTVSGVTAAYNGTFTVTDVNTNSGSYTKFSYYTGSANEAQTTSTGTVTSTVYSIYPGYTPAAPSNVTWSAAAGTVTITWTNEYAGSSSILGYGIYDSKWNSIYVTSSGLATSYSFTGTLDTTYYVLPYNNYGMTPRNAVGGVSAPASGVIPRANVSAYWGGQTILADIEYYKTSDDLNSGIPPFYGNTTRIRNGIWFSNPGAFDTFDPLAMFTVGTPDTTITALTVLPQGLLIHTSNTNQGSGLYLLRGSSIGVITEEELVLNSTLELVRSNISTNASAERPGSLVASWPSTGTVAFLDDKSLVWHTNTRDVRQLDTYGPLIPSTGGTYDCVATWGQYLFVKRRTRLLVMRDLGDTGAWTEIAFPSGAGGIQSLCVYDNSLYFINLSGSTRTVYRMALNPTSAAFNEYGMVDGQQTSLYLSTPVLGESNKFDKQFWHRVGIRAYGETGSTLQSMSSYDQSYLLGSPKYTVTTSVDTRDVGYRYEKVFPVHGPSQEICVRFTFLGYVEIEGVTFYVHGHQQRRK